MGVVDNLYKSSRYKRFAYGTPDGTNGEYVARRSILILDDNQKRNLNNADSYDPVVFRVADMIQSLGPSHATGPLYLRSRAYATIFRMDHDNGQSV